MILGQYPSNIKQIPQIPPIRYENIFRMYTTKDNQYYYNLLQSIYVSGEIDPFKIYYFPVKERLPWSNISFNAYGTIELWWLVCLVNKIYNPIIQPEVGTVLKIIRSEYVSDVLDEINNALQ